MKKAALVLEGGGNRGVFTAGVLDVLMEEQIFLPYVVGVSAGSCNAVDYVSRQPLRTKNCMIPEDGEAGNRLTVREMIRQRSLFDMDRLFAEYPYHQYPFDFETFFASQEQMRCEIVLTSCRTGEAVYAQEFEDPDRLMKLCRASCSLPLVAPIVTVDGEPYLDGGIADSIPVRRVLREGYKKCVVVTTRPYGYRKETSPLMLRLCRIQYGRKYPAFVKAFADRARVYNKTMELIERLEAKGHILVLRPEAPVISKAETDQEKLLSFYEHGREVTARRLDELKAYLGV